MASQSQARAAKAAEWVQKEIAKLEQVIEDIGTRKANGQVEVAFGTLFYKYQDISDTLAGILQRAKKYGVVHFEGETLFQGYNDNTIVTLLNGMPAPSPQFKQSFFSRARQSVRQVFNRGPPPPMPERRIPQNNARSFGNSFHDDVDEDFLPPPPPEDDVQDTEDVTKYVKMLQVGLSVDTVKQKMEMDSVNPFLLDPYVQNQPKQTRALPPTPPRSPMARVSAMFSRKPQAQQQPNQSMYERRDSSDSDYAPIPPPSKDDSDEDNAGYESKAQEHTPSPVYNKPKAGFFSRVSFKASAKPAAGGASQSTHQQRKFNGGVGALREKFNKPAAQGISIPTNSPSQKRPTQGLPQSHSYNPLDNLYRPQQLTHQQPKSQKANNAASYDPPQQNRQPHRHHHHHHQQQQQIPGVGNLAQKFSGGKGGIPPPSKMRESVLAIGPGKLANLKAKLGSQSGFSERNPPPTFAPAPKQQSKWGTPGETSFAGTGVTSATSGVGSFYGREDTYESNLQTSGGGFSNDTSSHAGSAMQSYAWEHGTHNNPNTAAADSNSWYDQGTMRSTNSGYAKAQTQSAAYFAAPPSGFTTSHGAPSAAFGSSHGAYSVYGGGNDMTSYQDPQASSYSSPMDDLYNQTANVMQQNNRPFQQHHQPNKKKKGIFGLF